MTTVLLVLVCLLAAAVFVQFAALIEMFNQLQQVRRHLEMFDMANPIDLGAAQGLRPSATGLPAELDEAEHALVLFLSNKCQTCFTLARALAGGVLPPNLWLVLVPVTGGDASEFIQEYELIGERILVDEQALITNGLGMDVTPAAIVVKSGQIDKAHTVPTTRQLYAALEPGSKTAVALNERT